jgi:poly(A) polymerase
MDEMEKRQKPQLHTNWIDPKAKEIVERLQNAGFTTYLVGGCVRDLLAGIHPKDYDIATSAMPEEVYKVIRGSYIIGRRFRLVLVKRGPHQYEVATFRRSASQEEIEAPDTPGSDNFFGTPQEDATRRDFTINALFYDPISNELVDYVDGQSDIDAGILKMIGDPDLRLKEDPIRVLRAIRLTHKLRFSLEENLRSAIQRNAPEVGKSLLPRKREEYLKILRLPDPLATFIELMDLGVLDIILPSLAKLLKQPEHLTIFDSYFRRCHEIIIDSKNPIHLVLPIVLSLHAIYGDDIAHFMKEVEPLFRDEMGLFKIEQAQLFGAIELITPLKNIKYHQRKGSRKQRSFLERETLPFALHTAEQDYRLNAQELLYWKQLISKTATT